MSFEYEGKTFESFADFMKFRDEQWEQKMATAVKQAEGKNGELMVKAIDAITETNKALQSAMFKNKKDRRFVTDQLQDRGYCEDVSKWLQGIVIGDKYTRTDDYQDAMKRIEDADGYEGERAAGRLENHAKGNQKTLTAATAATLGNLVPTGLRDEIYFRVGNYNIMRQLAMVMPVSGKTSINEGSTRATAYYAAENASPAGASSVTTNQITLDPHRLTCYDTFTTKLLLSSGPDVVSFLARKFGDGIGYTELNAFTNGTGTNQPTGFADDTAYSSVTSVSMLSSSLAYGDLPSLESNLGTPYLPFAAYQVSREGMSLLKSLNATTNHLIWADAQSGGHPTINGYPIWLNETISDVYGSSGSYTTRIYLGDWQAYMIGDLQVLAMDLRDGVGEANWLQDVVSMKIVSYNDGELIDQNAIVYLDSVT